MVKCSKCNSDAVTFIRYNGNSLCSAHFIQYVERRAKKEIRAQLNLKRGKNIAVAVSGGKDSSVALMILHDVLGKRKDVDLSAITVDEGIEGYRPQSIEKVKKLCRSLDVPHHIISFKERFDMTMDDISRSLGDRTPCAYCGVLRRRCMNLKGKEIDADYIATGLNLDDSAQAILMYFTRGDVERLARMGPHSRVQPGLIPRIQPLRTVPEKESLLYAMMRGIDFCDSICPYYDAALRNEYRSIIDEMERRTPGSKFSILSSCDALNPMMKAHFPPAELKVCECGEPTVKGKCMACELMDEIKGRMRAQSSS